MSMEKCVRRGITLLDKLCSDWWQRVSTSKLDMSSLSNCVLAQLYGQYTAGLVQLNIMDGEEDYEHGFDAHHDGTLENMYDEYSELTEWWAAEIILRHNHSFREDTSVIVYDVTKPVK